MAKVKFDEIARECRSTFKGDKTGVAIVGLEHIVPNEMLVKNYEVDTENTFSKSFKKGQILFGRRRAYQQKAGVATFDGICSGDITVIEAIQGKVDKDLLPFIIQNERFFEHAVQGSAGSLSPRVKWEHLASYEFDLPPLYEQKILADKLWAAYRLKESYKKLLAATDEMVKSQFIEMFKEAPRIELGKMASFINGSAFKPEEWSSDGLPIVRIQNLTQDDSPYNYYDGDTTKKIVIDNGDMLVSWSATLGVFLWSKGKALLNQHIFKVSFDKLDVNKDFFVYAVKLALDKMSEVAHGSTMRHVVKKDFNETIVANPSINDQESFALIAKQADKSGSVLQHMIAC